MLAFKIIDKQLIFSTVVCARPQHKWYVYIYNAYVMVWHTSLFFSINVWYKTPYL